MRKLIWVLLLAGCAESVPAGRDFPVMRSHGRAGLVTLGMGITHAAEQCTLIAKQGDIAFGEWCVNVLIPAKDALVLGLHASETWNSDAEEKTACAGLATATALRRLEDGFRARRMRMSTYAEDAVVIGDEFSGTAKCDPLHPGVFVTVTRPDLPPNYADYPR